MAVIRTFYTRAKLGARKSLKYFNASSKILRIFENLIKINEITLKII